MHKELLQTAVNDYYNALTVQTHAQGRDYSKFDLIIRGLDKAMQTIRCELTNNLAKLSEVDYHIALDNESSSRPNTLTSLLDTALQNACVAWKMNSHLALRLPQQGRPCAPKSAGSEKLSIRTRTQRSPTVFAYFVNRYYLR